MAVMTAYPHVELNDKGMAIISGTTMKVIELVEEHFAHGWSADELQFQHPYLTLGQIHMALAYYWDHKQELDQEMERRWEYAEQMRLNAKPSPFLERLKSKQPA